MNNTRIPALFGEDNFGNIFWGLEIQTQWQIDSIRQQQTRTSPRIDEYAWFAAINYQLTAVPYIVAMNVNLVPQATFEPPRLNQSPNKFPTTYEAIDSEIAEEWTEYFEAVKILQENSTYMSLQDLQKILWTVHNTTLIKAIPTFQYELNLLNSREKKFANGFAHFVEIMTIANANTGYNVTQLLNTMFFPHRVLRRIDTPPLIFDMSAAQNLFIAGLFFIDDLTLVPGQWEAFLNIFALLVDYIRTLIN